MVKERKDYGIIHKGFVWLKTRWRRYKKKRYARKVEKLIRKAEKLRELTGYRYFVIMMRGKLRVIPKRKIKQWMRNGTFRKDVTMQMIEQKALYVTKLKPRQDKTRLASTKKR